MHNQPSATLLPTTSMAEALTDIIKEMDQIIEFLRNSKDPKHNAHEYQRATIPQFEVFETDLANAYKLIYGQLPSDGKRLSSITN
jgi:hypothetical protein